MLADMAMVVAFIFTLAKQVANHGYLSGREIK